MGKQIVIQAENLTKEYRVFKTNSKRLTAVLFGLKRGMKRTALDNISFEIRKGEKVAFLGSTGAGRTTLLKILCGITYPTSGKLTVKGKTNAIFDLKSGFVSELPGTDNLFIKGSLVGLTHKEIKEHREEILDFSGTRKIIEMPIKTYVPGMAAMLGFAIHTAKKPEILLMDENFVLSDKALRDKAVARLKEIVNDPDVTYVMTTKNLAFAREMCDRGIIMEKGTIVFDGPIGEAITLRKQMLKKPAKKKKKKKTLEEQMEAQAAETALHENDHPEEEEMLF